MSDCIFCSIAEGKIPTNKIYEDDKVIAFNDITPQSPVHILIIPKLHVPSIIDVDEDSEILNHIFKVIKRLVKEQGLDEKGFRIVNNCGEEGGQTVPHLHFHLLGGRQMQWPPG